MTWNTTIIKTWHVYLLHHVHLINEISVNNPTYYIKQTKLFVIADGQLKNHPRAGFLRIY